MESGQMRGDWAPFRHFQWGRETVEQTRGRGYLARATSTCAGYPWRFVHDWDGSVA
jgi:hypothetical protein